MTPKQTPSCLLAKVTRNATRYGNEYAVYWFRPEPATWVQYRVRLYFKREDAAKAYANWHNKWLGRHELGGPSQ